MASSLFSADKLIASPAKSTNTTYCPICYP
jgi:hypothetical protein